MPRIFRRDRKVPRRRRPKMGDMDATISAVSSPRRSSSNGSRAQSYTDAEMLAGGAEGDRMHAEAPPMTLVVEMMKDGIEFPILDAEEFVVEEGESFELGSLVNRNLSLTYSPFLDEFAAVAENIPRTLLVISPRGRLIHIFVDLGRHHRGQFDAWVDDKQLTADRPAEGAALHVVERHKRDGFVLRLRHKTQGRWLRVTGRFGVRGIPTPTTCSEALDYLREYIVPEASGQAGEALAAALDAYEGGRRSSRDDLVRRTSATAASRFAMSEETLKDATRYAYRKVFVWIVGKQVRVRRRPDRKKWMDALAELHLNRFAAPGDFGEFRESNRIEGLIDLAIALSDAGVLTRDDLAHMLDDAPERR